MVVWPAPREPIGWCLVNGALVDGDSDYRRVRDGARGRHDGDLISPRLRYPTRLAGRSGTGVTNQRVGIATATASDEGQGGERKQHCRCVVVDDECAFGARQLAQDRGDVILA